MKNSIFIKDWLELKPYRSNKPTDTYFLKIANEIHQVLTNDRLLYVRSYLDKDDVKFLACFLASYFEDIVSGSNIWNGFIAMHQELYQKKLPFYDTTEYYDKEINEQDVKFLIWYYIGTVADIYLDTDGKSLEASARVIMEILEKEYEYAPENEYLKTYYTLLPSETDYYFCRNLIEKIFLNSYLLYPDTKWDKMLADEEIFDEFEKKPLVEREHLPEYLYNNLDYYLLRVRSRLLSLRGKDWAAAVLGMQHPLYGDLKNMSEKVQSNFLYKGMDDKYVYLEHITSGKRFDMFRKSYDHCHLLTKIDTILYIGLVKWRGEWWFSGINFVSPYDLKFVEKERNSLLSQRQVDFLDRDYAKVSDILEKQEKAFLDFNQGSHIAFLPEDELDTFCKNFWIHYNSILGFSKKEQELAEENIRNRESHINPPDGVESGLVFFNPKSGVEIAYGINSAFPMENNPFFEEENSEEDAYFLLYSKEFSKELVLYCVERCKDKLTFFTEAEGKEYLEDLDFLLRFWKEENYHTVPSISLTDKALQLE